MKKLLLVFTVFSVCIIGSGFGQDISNEMYDLSRIRNGIRNKRISSHDPSGGNLDCRLGIKNGDIVNIAEIKGAGIINHIWITISPGPDELSRNDIILRMYWDGNEFPSVESPIGPFFGQGWNEQYNFSSFPLCAGPVNGSGLVSYFAMPFTKGARIEIENQTGKDINTFYYYVDYVEMDKQPKDLGRFHAWYNHELCEAVNEGVYGYNTDGKNNYVFADIKGKGHFVGINYYVQSPSPMWYGEGDDMWFIDGDTLPRIIGTGTEDFFNTAFCPKEPFYHPYYGYPRVNNDIGWLGRTHIYRFFVNDPIYFEKSVKGTIEHGHANDMTLDLATVAYWYQTEATPLPPAPTKEMRQPKHLIDYYDIHRWKHEWRENMGSDPKLWGNEKENKN